MATKPDYKAKRVTIMIPGDLDVKIRTKQSQIIAKTNSSCSYSRVVADALRGEYKLK